MEVSSFMSCLDSKDVSIPEHRKDKAKTYAFLSANNEPGKRINEAAQAGFWNHNHHSLNALKTFLEGLNTANDQS